MDNELEDELRSLMREHFLVCRKCMSLLNTMEKTICFSREMNKAEKVPSKVISRVCYEIHVRYEKKEKK